MIYKEFYSEVGKMLYAIAKADGSISKEERKVIHEMVLSKIVPLESSTDEFGTDSAFYVEMEFDYLNENLADPDDAFESFINYIEEHYSACNGTLKHTILNVAEYLIESFHETNIRDHQYMIKLRNTLTKSLV